MNCSRNKIDIVSSAQVKQICYSNFSMRDKELLATKAFFVILVLKTVIAIKMLSYY